MCADNKYAVQTLVLSFRPVRDCLMKNAREHGMRRLK